MQTSKIKMGFTLVELAVVIVILIVLGAISLLSMNGCSSVARNSARETDVANISKALDLYATSNLKYPNPGNSYSLYLDGDLAFKQGEFTEKIVKQINNIDKIPLDPLDKTYYTYSLSQKLGEFQIGYLLEKGDESLSKTHADGPGVRITKIAGNFNGVFIKSGRKIYSLVSMIINGLNYDKRIETYSGVATEASNIDDDKKIEVSNNGYYIDFAPIKLSDYFPSDKTSKIAFANKLKEAYNEININIFIDNGKLDILLQSSDEDILFQEVSKLFGN